MIYMIKGWTMIGRVEVGVAGNHGFHSIMKIIVPDKEEQ